MLAVQHRQGPALKRQLSRDHLEENDTEGVDVSPMIYRTRIAELLRSHIGASAKAGA